MTVPASGRVRTVPLFIGSYLAVWTLVGVAVYALHRPHGPFAAGAIAIAAGVYEFDFGDNWGTVTLVSVGDLGGFVG